MDLLTRNQNALMGRKPGDIIFFHPTLGLSQFVGHAICWITREYYYHGAIVLDYNTAIESDPTQGVHTSLITDYMSAYVLDLFRLKEDQDTALIVQSAKDCLGWSYDYGNVAWAGIGFLWYYLTGRSIFRRLLNPADETNSVDSEEFIDIVFKKAGINLNPDIPSSNISAEDISKSDLLFRVNAV